MVAMSYAIGIVGALLLLLLIKGMMSKPDISGADARQRVEAGAQLIDVRTPAEFASGHLPKAQNIPLGELDARVAALKREDDIVLYCASGARSTRAAALLRGRGYTKVANLGGMSRW